MGGGDGADSLDLVAEEMGWEVGGEDARAQSGCTEQGNGKVCERDAIVHDERMIAARESRVPDDEAASRCAPRGGMCKGKTRPPCPDALYVRTSDCVACPVVLLLLLLTVEIHL